MRQETQPKSALWMLLIIILLILFVRLLDTTLGAVIGKGEEVALLVVALIFVLWMIGTGKRKKE